MKPSVVEKMQTNTYTHHLQHLKNLRQEEVKKQRDLLISTTPNKEWPYGFPASLDPKLIIIGVSPGNSPYQPTEENKEPTEFQSEPGIIDSKNSHYYYPDKKSYWKKIRFLSHAYFSSSTENISEFDSLSLTTHINLGEESAGKATANDAQEEFVKWASTLTNTIHNPDTVILLGLKTIIRNDRISKWWNHANGLIIDWKKPTSTTPFPSKSRTYRFEEWQVTNSHHTKIRVILWPNHPSRAPFGGMEGWERSVLEYFSISRD